MDHNQDEFKDSVTLPHRKDSRHSVRSWDPHSDTDSVKMAIHNLETPPNGPANNRYQASSLYYGLRRGPVVIGLIEMLLGIILLFPSILVGNLETCYVTIGLTIFTGMVGISLGCICIQPPNPMEISEHDVRSLLPMLEAYLALSVLAACLAIASIGHGAAVVAVTKAPDNSPAVVSLAMGIFLFLLNLVPVTMVVRQLLKLRKPNVCQHLLQQSARPPVIGGYHPSASSFNLNGMAQAAAMRRSSSSSNTLQLLPDNQVNLLKRLDNNPPPAVISTGRDVFHAGRSVSVTVKEYK